MTELLLVHGASCNKTSIITRMCSSVAVALKLAIVGQTLSRSAFVICSGDTALHAAVRARAGSAVQVLLDNNAKVNVPANNGYAPLHEAAEDAVITQLLLENGADPDIKNSLNHLQPLHMAASRLSADVCKLLLSAGADVQASSKHGTPLSLALRANHAVEGAFNDNLF